MSGRTLLCAVAAVFVIVAIGCDKPPGEGDDAGTGSTTFECTFTCRGTSQSQNYMGTSSQDAEDKCDRANVSCEASCRCF